MPAGAGRDLARAFRPLTINVLGAEHDLASRLDPQP